MIIVVFRSRVRPENAERYYALVDKMAEIATQLPGFISYKSFYAEDGERVTINAKERTHQAGTSIEGILQEP